MKDFTRAALGQGLLLGWGDELEAAARSLGSRSYEDVLADIRAQNEQYYQESPYTALGAEVAGGIAPAIASMFIPGGQVATATRGASVLNRIAQIQNARKAAEASRGLVSATGKELLEQGALGAVAGAGAAEGDIGDVIDSATFGGGVSGVIGAAMPGTQRVARNLFEKIPTEGNIARSAAGQVYRERGAGLDDFRAAIPDAIARDRALGIDTSSLLNLSPRLARQAEMLGTRGGDASEMLGERAERQIAGARENVGAQINRGLGPGDYFDERDRMLTEMQTRAAPLYDAARAHGVVTDPKVLDYLNRPQFQEASRMAERLAAAEGKVLDLSQPTVENLDQIKRGLDALINNEKGVDGKYSELGRVYINQKNKWLKDLDDAVPEYGAARRQYAGDAEVLQALDDGYNKFDSLQYEQVARMARDMSVEEKNAFKNGVVRNLFDSINDTSQERNFAKQFANNPNMLEKLKPLFDSPAQFDLFDAAMKRQSQIFRQEAGIVRGSQTAGRQAAMSRFQDDPYASALMSLGTDSSLPGMVMRALSTVNLRDSVAKKMAQMLSAGTPDEIAAVVTALDNYATRSEASAWAGREAGRAIGSGARNVVIENYDTRPSAEDDTFEALLERASQYGVQTGDGNIADPTQALNDVMERWRSMQSPE